MWHKDIIIVYQRESTLSFGNFGINGGKYYKD